MAWLEDFGRFYGSRTFMGKLGIVFCAVGTIFLILFLGMDTSVESGGMRVHNVGLLNLKNNLVIVSLFFAGIGIFLMVTGRKIKQNVVPGDRAQNNYHSLNNKNEIYNAGTGYKKCKFCAEDIKKEAIKCRFCGSNVVAEESDLSDKTRPEMSTVNDEHSFDERILCRDGTCVGTVGKNGKCRVCGLSNE